MLLTYFLSINIISIFLLKLYLNSVKDNLRENKYKSISLIYNVPPIILVNDLQ